MLVNARSVTNHYVLFEVNLSSRITLFYECDKGFVNAQLAHASTLTMYMLKIFVNAHMPHAPTLRMYVLWS